MPFPLNTRSLLGLLLVLLAACLCSAAPTVDETPAPSLAETRLSRFANTLTDEQLLAGVALVRELLPSGLDPLDVVYAIKNHTELALTSSQMEEYRGIHATTELARRDVLSDCEWETVTVIGDAVGIIASLFGISWRVGVVTNSISLLPTEAASLQGLIKTIASSGASIDDRVMALFSLLSGIHHMYGITTIANWIINDLSWLEGIKALVIIVVQLGLWFGTDGLAFIAEVAGLGVGLESLVADTIAATHVCGLAPLPTLPPPSLQFDVRERFYNATAANVEVFLLDLQGTIHFRLQRQDLAWTDWGAFRQNQPFTRLATSRNLGGHLEVYGIGRDGAVYQRYENPTNGFYWTDWSSFGGWSSAVTVASNDDGRLEMFVAGSHGRVYHRWQYAPNNGWTDFETLGSSPSVKELVVVPNQNGRLEVFGLTTDARITHARQNPAAYMGFENWEDFGAWGISNVVATRNGNNLEVFCIGADQRVYHRWQNGQNSYTWTDWAALYVQGNSQLTKQAKQLAVTQQKNELPVLFLIGLDDAAYLTALTPEGWSAWVKLGGNVSSIKALTTRDGIVQVYALFSGDKNIYLAKQLKATDPLSWSHWIPLN